MSSLLYGECEKWIDEDGSDVVMVPSPFGGIFYIDNDSRGLRKKYNPYFKIEEVPRMGSAGLEGFAENIVNLFPVMGEFGGFAKSDLEKFEGVYQGIGYTQRLLNYGFMREKIISNMELSQKEDIIKRLGVFPTEDIIEKCFDLWEFLKE